jgi:hypothetical protein
MRMLAVVLDVFGEGMVRGRVEETVPEEVECSLVGVAQPLAGLHHLVENRLQAARAGDGAKDGADRSLLLPHVLELTNELGAVGGDAGHSRSLGRGPHPRSQMLCVNWSLWGRKPRSCCNAREIRTALSSLRRRMDEAE